MRSSQLSMMKTRRTYSLMLLNFFLFPPSNMSKGARRGTKSTERNSSWPSTEKCLTAAYSSCVTSSGLRIQMGFWPLRWSHSCVTSLIFFVFFFFLRLGLVDVLDLGRVVVLVALLLVVVVVVRDLLLLRLLDVQLDGEADELRVLLHEVLEAALLEVLGHVLLHREDDARAAADALGLRGVGGDR